MSARSRKPLRGVKSHSERILIAKFDSNSVTTVIVVYSPTNVAQIQDAEWFYEKLRAALEGAPVHNFLTVQDDVNASLGPEDAPFAYHDETNRNGKFLAEFMVSVHS